MKKYYYEGHTFKLLRGSWGPTLRGILGSESQGPGPTFTPCPAHRLHNWKTHVYSKNLWPYILHHRILNKWSNYGAVKVVYFYPVSCQWSLSITLLKTSENQRFFDAHMGYRKRPQCVKSVQIQTRKNSVFGNFSHSASDMKWVNIEAMQNDDKQKLLQIYFKTYNVSAVQWFHWTDVFFLTSIGNLQNYTISRLSEACYLCTSMGKLMTKACWIILLLYLLFFNATRELKQQSSTAIIRENPTLRMQMKTIRKLSKPILYYNNSSAVRGHWNKSWTSESW